MTQDPKLLIFEFDGVLVDSEYLAVRAEQRVLSEAGFEMTEDDIANSFVGRSYPDMFAILEERFGKPVPEELGERIQREAVASFPTELQAIDGMKDLLTGSSEARCIATSSPADRLDLSLDVAGLRSFFKPEALFLAEYVEHGKPAPDLFLYAADHMGFPPERCIVIEDSFNGVTAAIAAQMDVVAFTAGKHMRPPMVERLKTAGATKLAASAAELEGCLDELLAK